MDIHFPGLRDRRIAASEETRSTQDSPNRERPSYIYGQGSHARSHGAMGAGRSGGTITYDRTANHIRAIILHQTSGNRFLRGVYMGHRRPTRGSRVVFTPGTGSSNPPPRPEHDRQVRSDHTLDRIAAHFVVLISGTIFYTHDVQFIIASAGGAQGIDIEFAGVFDRDRRLPVGAIQSARRFIAALKRQIPTISHIHPHGQVQRMDTRGTCGGTTGNVCDKWASCPGPDIWVNVGMWAVRHCGLQCAHPPAGYQNNGIAPAQQDMDYDQGIGGLSRPILPGRP